jgi:AraC-like DNA-binding protein
MACHAHVYDLVALMLSATREAIEIAKGRGLRVAKLRGIKADIVENIGRRNLLLDDVAKRRGISPSYRRKLFDEEGTNFTDFVLGPRLACAHRMLCDPLFAAQPISGIASEAGFGDLSHFNQAFHRRYGATPSDVRGRAASRREQTPTRVGNAARSRTCSAAPSPDSQKRNLSQSLDS